MAYARWPCPDRNTHYTIMYMYIRRLVSRRGYLALRTRACLSFPSIVLYCTAGESLLKYRFVD